MLTPGVDAAMESRENGTVARKSFPGDLVACFSGNDECHTLSDEERLGSRGLPGNRQIFPRSLAMVDGRYVSFPFSPPSLVGNSS